MRARQFVALFCVAAMVAAFAAWTGLETVSTGVFAQGPPPGKAVVAAARRLARPAVDVAVALRRRFSDLPKASSRWRSICSLRRTSTRIARTGSTSAITAATTRVSCMRCGIAAHWREAARVGVVGQLQ